MKGLLLNKQALLDRISRALGDGDWESLYLSAEHPFLLRVFNRDTAFTVRIYVWNITHGGGEARAANEYRIQVTGVTQFSTAGVDRTIVLGWWDAGQVFAGWDVAKHLGPLGASPSLQVHEETLRQAAAARVATQRKANDEIVIAFEPRFLGEYVAQLSSLHTLATSTDDLGLLTEAIASPEEAEQVTQQATSEPRRALLVQVVRRIRDAAFADRVLRAYGHRCCLCGAQLRLVDAAHIVPVAQVNNDTTANGLALCVIHHRAFDRALVTITESYQVVLNPDRLAALAADNLVGGLEPFTAGLRRTLALPDSTADRPDPALISEANRLRGWTKIAPLG
jgi:putative restriction endonuclease